MKKVILICTLIFASFFAAPGLVHAQNAAQDDFPDDPGETDVPFDGGISLLVMAGVAYGVKMKLDKKD